MSAPIVIHHPSPAGGRQVTICGRIAGLAYDDHDVLEFLRRAGLPDAKQLLDRNGWSSEAGGRTRTWQRSGALVLERDARDLSLPHVLTRGPESSSLAGIGRGSPVLTGHGGWAAARGEVRTGRTGRCRGGSRPPGPEVRRLITGTIAPHAAPDPHDKRVRHIVAQLNSVEPNLDLIARGKGGHDAAETTPES